MDTHETVTEFIFEGLERLIEQHFAAFVAQGHVFVVRNEIHHLIQRNQLDPFTGSGADMAARSAAAFGSRAGQGGELGTIGALGSL
ncbi:hypothetical protein D3C79_1056390 [compost metagenome]